MIQVFLAVSAFLMMPALALASGGHGGIEDIKWDQIGWLVFDTLVLVVLVWIYGRRPISNFFRQRHQGIVDAIEQAGSEEKQAKERLVNVDQKLEHIEEEIEQIHNQTTTFVKKTKSERMDVLKDEIKRIKAETKELIQLEQNSVEAELKKSVVDKAYQQVEEMLSGQVTPEDKKRFIDSFIVELSGRSGHVLESVRKDS